MQETGTTVCDTVSLTHRKGQIEKTTFFSLLFYDNFNEKISKSNLKFQVEFFLHIKFQHGLPQELQ